MLGKNAGFQPLTISDSAQHRRDLIPSACLQRAIARESSSTPRPPPMPLFTLGISHHTAPVAIRERLSFTPEQLPASLRAVMTLPGVHEAVILSTCNRTEIYAELTDSAGTALADWLAGERVPEDPEV